MREARRWQSADLFRQIPKDLTESTTSGAIISIACIAVMILLFLGEIISYISPRTQADMVILPDVKDGGTIKVSLDITFPKMPCAILTLDILDVLHHHVMNAMQNIRRTPLSAEGEPLANRGSPDIFIGTNEGCRLDGFITVTKVPGNFHISSHGRQDLAARHFPGGINVEHIIHHLSFGSTDVKKLSRKAQLHPLDGTESRSAAPMGYQYYLDIVPTIYEESFSTASTYQFTGTMTSIPVTARQMGAVIFQYQLSPITVRYSSARVSFTHFLTYVCAIVGGVFTVAGLLSRLVHSSVAQLQRRLLGKAD